MARRQPDSRITWQSRSSPGVAGPAEAEGVRFRPDMGGRFMLKIPCPAQVVDGPKACVDVAEAVDALHFDDAPGGS